MSDQGAEATPPQSRMPVRIVGPNPAMDRLQVVDQLVPGRVHSVITTHARAGGKSFIVARTMRRLGLGVAMYGFLGGSAATLAREECDGLGIVDRHTAIKGETRINPVIIERTTGRSTVFNEPGPFIGESEQQRFWLALEEDVGAAELLVCTGSLPRGLGSDFYARVCNLARQRGARAVVDASGDVLKQALQAAPWMLKCNLDEFAGATGGRRDDLDGAGLQRRIEEQVLRGTNVVIVTNGDRDFLAADQRDLFAVSVPVTEVVNATGSGDTFLGCFVAAMKSGADFPAALRFATAGGAANAGQLEPGLPTNCDLGPLAERVNIEYLGPLAVPAK